MNITRSTQWVFVLSMLLCALLCSCGESFFAPQIKQAGDPVISLPLGSAFKGFDPAFAGDQTSIAAQGLVYEPLYQYDYFEESYELEPCLAEEMGRFSEDGLTYTVKLKDGIVFQDDPCFAASDGKGRAVTVEDFIYAFRRIADVKTRSTGYWIFDGKIVGLDDFREHSKNVGKASEVNYDMPVPGLRAVDSRTLEIQLTQPYPQLEYVLAMPYAVPVAHEAVEYYGVEFQNHPVGTGPYRLEAWHRGLKVIFVKNPTYRLELFPAPKPGQEVSEEVLQSVGKPLPLMPRVELQSFLESQPMWLNFMRGLLDQSGIPKDNFDAAIDAGTELKPQLAEKGVRLHINPVMSVYFMIINMEDPILGSNKLLRQAISLAYDPKRRIDLFLNGRGMVATQIVPPLIAGHIDDYVNPYLGQDLQRARQLLAQAGYPNGDGLPPIKYETTGGDSTTRQMAELFVNEMSQIGIRVEVETNTWPQYLEKLKSKKFQIGSSGWGADYPDAENFLQLLYGPNQSPGPNSCNYQNDRYDELYRQVAAMQDSEQRRQLIREMIDLVVEDCPLIYSFHPMAYGLSHDWYHNYRYRDVGQGYLKYRWVDTERRAMRIRQL